MSVIGELFWKKRESFSAHLAYGLAFELALAAAGLRLETAFVAVLVIGGLWELGGELVTTKLRAAVERAGLEPGSGYISPPALWKSRALDVPPWVIGAAVGWLYLHTL